MIALLDNLTKHLPFTLLNKRLLKQIETSAQIAYYPNGTTLLKPQQSFDSLFYIIKGSVEAREEALLIDVSHSDDSFGGIELIENQSSSYSYSVTEELICYEIPRKTFLELCKESQEFRDYFFCSIIERMDMLKSKKEHGSVADMMVARVDNSVLNSVTVVGGQTPVIEALSQMRDEKSVAILVENKDGYGIVTDTNLREYILCEDRDKITHISQIQTYPIISIDDDSLMFNVLLLMTEHSIKHLPVFDSKQKLLGILELVDLLSFFSNQSHLITVQMDGAEDLESLISASKRVSQMVGALHSKGVKSRYIAKLVAEIKKKMYTKLFTLILPKEWQKNSALVLLGSEGREEQILRTDQDNALIFADGFIPTNQEEVTQRFIEALDEIGFPRCEGGVMIINPKWRKSVAEYKKDIRHWIEHPNSDGLMDMAIFFDSLCVAGDSELYKQLREYLFVQVSTNKSILLHFAKAIENFESPLGIFSNFSTQKGHDNEIDIKKGALFALVHGVRALALEYGIDKTNTTLRIKALNDIGYMNKEDATDILEALEVINTLRLHAQLAKLEKGTVMDNYISLTALSKLEKDVLKEALKTVEKFKKRVSYHFHLSSVG
ncbi:MAG: putative nucleotidyltransferase substrate binding domain-containing protein [Sulfurovum sp.]